MPMRMVSLIALLAMNWGCPGDANYRVFLDADPMNRGRLDGGWPASDLADWGSLRGRDSGAGGADAGKAPLGDYGTAARDQQPLAADRGSVGPGLPAVPYFYQQDNALYPESTCQNTSLAMLLAFYGCQGKPDDITKTYGKSTAQSPAGLAEVFNGYVSQLGFAQRLAAHTDVTIAEFRALLAAGKPVIVHGYFPGSGHVIVTLGYSGNEYIVNDPNGRWNQTFKGGYTGAQSATVGHMITYGAAAFEDAIATSDGSTFLPLWFHEITP